MLRQLLLAAVLTLAVPGASRSAEGGEPEIYYFGATDCRFCENGLTFLEKLQSNDRRVHLHVYDIIANEDDAATYVRVVAAIGLLDPRVPMTIVGRHVIIGYEGDDTTGLEISMAIEQCRLKACPDLVHGLLTYGPEIATTGDKNSWIVERRFASATKKR